jgi:NAD+ synthase (glutamine-hydrolysing)
VPRVRIALAQVNSTVGDLAGNAAAIIEWTQRAADAGACLVVFPEMMLTGYPVEDLALRASFVHASAAALEQTAARLADRGLAGVAVVTGYLGRYRGDIRRTGQPVTGAQNSAALLWSGRVAVTTAKHHLPNYGVFDEYRYFVPGDRTPVFRLGNDRPVQIAAARGGAAVVGGARAGQVRESLAASDRDRAAGDRGAIPAVDVAIAICEDLWQDGGPVALTRQARAGLLVVPNASPYERGKDQARLDLCVRRAREAGASLAYVNMVGGQDELVFDGDSIIVDAGGALLARGPQFEEALIVTDLELPGADPELAMGESPAEPGDGTGMLIERVALPAAPMAARPGTPAPCLAEDRDSPGSPAVPALAPPPIWPRLSPLAEIYTALVTGVRDYVTKNRFPSVILGLSGGIDSALTATIATDAVGADRVHVVLMPSRYSSGHSVADAEDLVKRQGVHARTVPVQSMVDSFQAILDLHGLAAENLQARVRGIVLMSISNAEGHLVLTTGNKSELATGYSTLYGDSAGGFGPIKDVPKVLVWDLARWRNEEAVRRGELPPIPENSITKPPSAELAPGQLDSDSLPDYSLLDAVLDDYVVHDLGPAELAAAGHDPRLVDRVVAMVDHAEYKRRQYPPGPKITPRNFGRDRRLPITNRWSEPSGSADH